MASKEIKTTKPQKSQFSVIEEAEPPPGSQGVHVGGKSLRTAQNQHGDPKGLNYDEWKGEHGAQKLMTNMYGLTNCVPVFVSQDWNDPLFESNDTYYLWARDGNTLVRILHGLEKIKQIITDWGQGALSMEYMGFV